MSIEKLVAGVDVNDEDGSTGSEVAIAVNSLIDGVLVSSPPAGFGTLPTELTGFFAVRSGSGFSCSVTPAVL
jgi:hypothetical protein